MLAITGTDHKISSPEEDCHQTPSSAATTIAGNDDLLTEILVYTPVKSLMRFKSVSKHWFSLISASHFSLLRTLRRPNRRPSGLFLENRPPLIFHRIPCSELDFLSFSNNNLSGAPFRSLNFKNNHLGIKILQSCNGLLLCRTYRRMVGKAAPNFYIYNPTTKQYSSLPPLTGAEYGTSFGGGLAFDPLKSVHYKVIYICSRSRDLFGGPNRTIYYCSVYIYSSETRSWRLRGNPFSPTHDIDMVPTHAVFWNSSIHWISRTGSYFRFDVDHESLVEMPEILFPGYNIYSGHLLESKGHLHLIKECLTAPQMQFDVFEMERDYSKWFVKYHVDLVGIVNEFPEMVRRGRVYYSVLGLVRDDDEDESLLLLHLPGKVLSYKFKDNTFKELLNLPPEKIHKMYTLQYGHFDAHVYIETHAFVL